MVSMKNASFLLIVVLLTGCSNIGSFDYGRSGDISLWSHAEHGSVTVNIK